MLSVLIAFALAVPAIFPTFAFAEEGAELIELEAEDARLPGEFESVLPAAQSAMSCALSVPNANRRQLVIVVRFRGDMTGDSGTGFNAPYTYGSGTQWQRCLAGLNGLNETTYEYPTLYSYLKKVSLGQCRLESVSPQTNELTGEVLYLDLPRARSEYSNADLLAADAIDAFNRRYEDYDARMLDGDGDKLADNVLVVPEVGGNAPGYNDPLWPKQINISGSTVGAQEKSVGVSSCTVIDSTRFNPLFIVGTVAHETLHAFGAQDLYRVGGQSDYDSNKPVGVWDIMAEHNSSRLMWPLAITREDCGWTTIPEAESTTVTLYAAESGKTQAVKLRTSLSASEYFVVEYRKASSEAADLSALDYSSSDSPSTIGGSGLVVYRVDETVVPGEGNKGSKDYVYIFREGESGASRGDGNSAQLRTAQLSAATRDTIGAHDLGKGLSDGAITYSSGQNSGIVITLDEENDDSVTFSVQYPNIEENELWEEVLGANGETPLASMYATETLIASDGASLYQLCADFSGRKAAVLKYDGSEWSSLGIVGEGCQRFDLACFDSSLYVCGTNYEAETVTLWRWSGSSWVQAASLAVAANFAIMESGQDALYTFVAGINGDGRLYKLLGNSLSPMGSAIPSAAINAARIIEVGGAPAVVYSEASSSSQAVNMSRLNSEVWDTTALSGSFATSIDIAKVGDESRILLVSNSRASVVCVDANGSASKPVSPAEVPAVMGGALAVSNNGLYAVVGHVGLSGDGKAAVYRISEDCMSWEQVGFDVVASTLDVDLCAIGNTLYCATSNSAAGRAQLHRYKVSSDQDQPGQTSPPSQSWKIATMPSSSDKVYNGSIQTGVSSNAGVTVVGGSAIRVGTYTATITPKEGYAWNTAGDRASRNLVWRIVSVPSVAYSSHVQNIGWQNEVRDGARGGTAGRALRVEAFRVRLANQPYPGGIRIRSHVQNIGWQGWASGGSVSGTYGKSLRVEAVKIELTGEMAKHFDVYYRAHVQNIGDTGWAKNGMPCGSAGYSYRMEALYIKLVQKGGRAPGSTANAFAHPWVSYQTHVQNIGWQSSVCDGATGGTTGQSLRVEAFQVKLVEQPCSGGIEVSSHVQNIGWQGWRSNGTISGTSGRSLRVEALKVRLTGEMSRRYDVYYRTHCQNVGWTGWAKNGNPSGTAGYSYRMEAVQIRIVPKGAPAPGSISSQFYQR